MIEVMTQPHREWFEYKEELNEAFDLHLFASMYGYTPEQVRALDPHDYLVLKTLSGDDDE